MDHRRPAVELPFLGRKDPTTGRNLCVWCGTAVTGRRISWCSDKCVLNYGIARGQQSACRKFLWKKERGVCQRCGTDVNKHRRELLKQHGCIPQDHLDRIEWEADHVRPLVEGGAHAPENLRTLCRMCHKDETRALRRRRSANRAS